MKQRISSHGIGASEIAAVAGMNPFASPWDVWRYKLGLSPGIDDADGEPIEWGHRNEPAIRQKYADVNNVELLVPSESMFHPVHDWARATPDGVVIVAPRKHLLQCKNVGYWMGREWRGGPPAYVVIQEQWEMMVTNLERADVAALVGGNSWQCFTVHRDQRMIDDLRTIGDEFWRLVVSRREPPIDRSDACREHFDRQLRAGSSVEIIADEEIEGMMAEWRSLHLESKHAESKIDTLRNRIRAALASADASTIRSSVGIASLREVGGGAKTDWRLVAELLASTKCSADEFRELVEANTKSAKRSLALYPPHHWGRDKK